MPSMRAWPRPAATSRKAGRSPAGNPFTQVTELDHDDDPMLAPGRTRGSVERLDSRMLGVQRDVGQPHGVQGHPGARSNQMGAVIPARRNRSTLARRDSPIACAPPASIARAASGLPHVALVTATMASLRQPLRERARVRLDLGQIDGQRRARGCRRRTMHIPYATRYGRTPVGGKCHRSAEAPAPFLVCGGQTNCLHDLNRAQHAP